MRARLSTLMRTSCSTFFFFNDTATTEIYPLSLHDALPISRQSHVCTGGYRSPGWTSVHRLFLDCSHGRSEEHTSELQSPCNLVCRLLLEKKKDRHPRVSPSGRRTLCRGPPESAPSCRPCAC